MSEQPSVATRTKEAVKTALIWTFWIIVFAALVAVLVIGGSEEEPESQRTESQVHSSTR